MEKVAAQPTGAILLQRSHNAATAAMVNNLGGTWSRTDLERDYVSGPLCGVRQEMVQRGEQVGAKAALVGVGHLKELPLQQVGDASLHEILGIGGLMTRRRTKA